MAGGKGGEQVPVAYLVPLRLFAGYFFLRSGLSKLGPGSMLARWAWDNPGGPYRSFLVTKAALYSDVVGHMVTYGEIAVGLCLAIGLLTRLSSAVAAAAVAHYLLGAGGGSHPTGELLLITLVTLALSGAGRFAGLDRKLHQRAAVLPFTLLY